MNQFQTILFDFDGTLFDTVEGITKSIQHALRKHGMDGTLEELRCFAGPPLVDKFMEVYGVDKALAEQLVTDFRERYVPIGVYESAPFPGLGEFLDRLRAAGLILGVATSKPQTMAELLLDRAGLQDKFHVIVGSRPGINNDQKWEIVRRAMELCGADPAAVVLVGDTKYDAVGAAKAGIPCIGAGWGYAAPGELEEAGVLCTARDFAELEALLLAEQHTK
jgi:phosphoglycolate phosphatase